MHSPVKLTLFPIDTIDDWLDRFSRAACTLNLKTTNRHSFLLVWDPNKKYSIDANLAFSDGWIIFRAWLGPKTYGICVNPQRLYFQNDFDFPTSIPERQLIDKQMPQMPSLDARIRSCLNLAKQFESHIQGFHGNPWPIARCRQFLHKKTSLHFGDGFQSPAGETLGSLLMKHGFFRVPSDFAIILLSENPRHNSVLSYKSYLEAAIKNCGITASVFIFSLDEVKNKNLFVNDALPGKVLLVAISGKRGMELPAGSERLLHELTANKIPFRLFSVDNKSLRWSALDQLGSLIEASGGISYSLELPWPNLVTPPMLLGVDLGHPQGLRQSWVTMSLISPNGKHVESWRCCQLRDETARMDTLVKGLEWTRAVIRRLTGNEEHNILVFRDGRLHKGETVETYKRLIPGRITFVEIAKNQVPEMFMDGSQYYAAPAGTECLPEGSTTPFIVPIPPRSQRDLSRVFKINLLESWDDMDLGIDAIIDLSIGLSYAPGLGLHAHALPAPLYWADGISAIGKTNHQFAGQPYVEVSAP